MSNNFKQVRLQDHHGKTIIPLGLATWIMETPDRRFVDNIEKSLLNSIATKEDALVSLIERSPEIIALAMKERELLDLAEKMPSDAWGLMEDLDELRKLKPVTNQLLELSTGVAPIIRAATSDNKYRMTVDDSNPEDVTIKLTLEGDFTVQPSFYQKGDVWKVSPQAAPVRIDVEPEFLSVRASTDGRTIKTLDEFMKVETVSSNIKDDIVNGLRERLFEGTSTTIPQILTSFNLVDYINTVFPKDIFGETPEEVISKVSSFTLVHLAQSSSEKSPINTQMYHGNNVVDPVRSSTRNREYAIHRFSFDDWSNPHPEWAQKGIVSTVSYGDFAGQVAIAKPSLSVEIENPYKGLELEAIRETDPVKGFDIRDWKIKDLEGLK